MKFQKFGNFTVANRLWLNQGCFSNGFVSWRCRMSGFIVKRPKSDYRDNSELKNRLYPKLKCDPHPKCELLALQSSHFGRAANAWSITNHHLVSRHGHCSCGLLGDEGGGHVFFVYRCGVVSGSGLGGWVKISQQEKFDTVKRTNSTVRTPPTDVDIAN